MQRTRKSSFSALAFGRLSALVSPMAFALTLAAAGSASALPVGQASDPHESLREAPSIEELDAAAVDFTSIVALSNCSGSLVRFTTSKPDDKAMVLTNGHCLSGFVKAGDAVVGATSSRTFSLLASSGRSSLGTLRATEIMYATMTGSDFALYRLSQTYAQIASRFRVDPLTIADTHPVAGTSIRIVSGYWRKIYSCSIDRFVSKLQEGTWTFTDSIRFLQPGCETIGGTSGSPIIAADTRAVIGINNTGNEGGTACSMNNPCEVKPDGSVISNKGAAYGQQLYQIYSCLTAANEIDLNRFGCRLNKPL
jgi:V8-like Glu-specific endopeptidase